VDNPASCIHLDPPSARAAPGGHWRAAPKNVGAATHEVPAERWRSVPWRPKIWWKVGWLFFPYGSKYLLGNYLVFRGLSTFSDKVWIHRVFKAELGLDRKNINNQVEGWRKKWFEAWSSQLMKSRMDMTGNMAFLEPNWKHSPRFKAENLPKMHASWGCLNMQCGAPKM
jgi:hypothetical protein